MYSTSILKWDDDQWAEVKTRKNSCSTERKTFYQFRVYKTEMNRSACSECFRKDS